MDPLTALVDRFLRDRFAAWQADGGVVRFAEDRTGTAMVEREVARCFAESGLSRFCQSGRNRGKPGVCPQDRPTPPARREPASTAPAPSPRGRAVFRIARSVAPAHIVEGLRRPKFNQLPKSPGKVRGFAFKIASKMIKDTSLGAEADAAVDKIVTRDLRGIVQKYGPVLGPAIIATGFLGGLGGVAATLGGAGALAMGAASSHAYVSALGVVAAGLIGSTYTGNEAAKRAVMPLLGVARWLRGGAPAQMAEEPDMRQVVAIARREWPRLIAGWQREMGGVRV